MTSFSIIADMNKRQYIDPLFFNDPGDLNYHYLTGNHVRAIAFLVCDNGNRDTPTNKPWSLEGSWCGDRIFAVSSEMYPNIRGYRTATHERPDRNLYDMIEDEFENISQPMLILLSGLDREFAARLLAGVSPDNLHFLWILGGALSRYPSPSLEDAVAKCFGSDWRFKYQEQSIIEEQELEEDREGRLRPKE